MTMTVDARYKSGKLVFAEPLPIPDNASVRVTIQTNDAELDAERAAWLKISAEKLARAWEDPADDVFNELLTK